MESLKSTSIVAATSFNVTTKTVKSTKTIKTAKTAKTTLPNRSDGAP